jgi:hypothetical protein
MEVMKTCDWRGEMLVGLVVRNDEVVGSIPTSSTNLLNHLPDFSVDRHGRKFS